MGLTVGVAIVSSGEAAQISHEPLLSNLDDPGDSGATLNNALAEATNELIRRIRARGLDPALVDAATVTDLKAAATFYALYSIFASQDQDEKTARRAQAYKSRFEEQLANVVIRTTNRDALMVQAHGVPVVRNHDSAPIVPGRDTRIPGVPDQPQTFVTRL